jgi:phosphoribosyl-AMP cyclohydrolase
MPPFLPKGGIWRFKARRITIGIAGFFLILLSSRNYMKIPPAVRQSLFERIQWDAQGLVPVIAQSADTNEVLMLAWMNQKALKNTLESGEMVYWSRSRNALWRKGETSGQTQALKELTLDCDGDALIAKVQQKGVACHTGRRTCFFYRLDEKGVTITQKPEVSPEVLYKCKKPHGTEAE